MRIETREESGTETRTVYAVYAETWYGTEKLETNYWNADEDKTRVEADVEKFQSKPAPIFEGEHSGKRGVYLNARLVSRTFTITSTDWA